MATGRLIFPTKRGTATTTDASTPQTIITLTPADFLSVNSFLAVRGFLIGFDGDLAGTPSYGAYLITSTVGCNGTTVDNVSAWSISAVTGSNLTTPTVDYVSSGNNELVQVTSGDAINPLQWGLFLDLRGLEVAQP